MRALRLTYDDTRGKWRASLPSLRHSLSAGLGMFELRLRAHRCRRRHATRNRRAHCIISHDPNSSPPIGIVASRKGQLADVLAEVEQGDTQILVGTQMLTKGHDFPGVTMVGVLNADQGLLGADFRSNERLAQTLLQVAGRAGRRDQPGESLYPDALPHSSSSNFAHRTRLHEFRRTRARGTAGDALAAFFTSGCLALAGRHARACDSIPAKSCSISPERGWPSRGSRPGIGSDGAARRAVSRTITVSLRAAGTTTHVGGQVVERGTNLAGISPDSLEYRRRSGGNSRSRPKNRDEGVAPTQDWLARLLYQAVESRLPRRTLSVAHQTRPPAHRDSTQPDR